MGLILKSDLQYKYSWTTIGDDDSKIKGEPDSSLFNRQEGFEVLYLINKFAEKNNFKQKESGLKTERLIKEYLPGNVRSQANVVSWLEANWKEYK